MPRSGPISLSLPSFSGATRRIILANLAVFFILAILHWVAPLPTGILHNHLQLEPQAALHGQLWQLATYSFINDGILNIAFGMLTLWFVGYLLEDARGSRWLTELYAVSVIGGALLAAALSYTRVLNLSPGAAGAGAWGGIFGLMIGIGVLFGDQEFYLWFVLHIKAKYMVAIYILIAVAVLLKDADSFNALLELTGTLAGYLYVKFAPRRGLAFGLAERYFGIRNTYYRAKRRRAARKFEVYMRKQNREVHFDKDGRYVDPDKTKDPTDKRWMN